MADDDLEYARSVARIARIAEADCHTREQAIDLLCDAVAFLLSECDTPIEQAISRINESAPVFEDAEQMVRSGGVH